MKTLKFTSEDKSIDVEYLVDLIGENDMMTVYQVTQYVDGVKQVNMNGLAQTFGMPDIYEQTVNDDNSRTKYTLVGFTAIAAAKNLTLEVYEDGKAVVTKNLLTALDITTSVLPAGTNGTPYTTTLEAEGGNTPYIWTTETVLPTGLTLSTDGVLSGTPTQTVTKDIDFKVTDQLGVEALATIEIGIAAA